MLTSISQVVLLVSLAVVIFIIFRKIPTLVKLTPEGQVVYPSIISRQGGEILNRIKGFSLACFLRKILVRMRIITMKGENGISKCIEKLKKSSPEGNAGGSDEYWEQLKK
jgi:hypothetical protein